MPTIYVTEFLWLTSIAASMSLATSLILLRKTSCAFAESLLGSLVLCKQIIVETYRLPNPAKEQRSLDCEVLAMHKKLLGYSDSLDSIYAKAVFEFRISK